MRKFTREECLQFLMAEPRTGKIATVRPDGRPHVAVIWYTLEGDSLLFTTWHTSVKARNIRHNPWISLTVDDERPPYAYVKYDGTAEFVGGLAESRHWATVIARRYMGDELAEEFGARNGVEGEYLVRVTPASITGETDIASF